MNAVCMFLYLMYSGVKREDLVPIVAPTYYTKLLISTWKHHELIRATSNLILIWQNFQLISWEIITTTYNDLGKWKISLPISFKF